VNPLQNLKNAFLSNTFKGRAAMKVPLLAPIAQAGACTQEDKIRYFVQGSLFTF